MTQDYYGATLLLSTTPTPERLSEIAYLVAEKHFPDTPYEHELTYTMPENMPIDMADQLQAYQRDAPEGSVYLLVYPTTEG